MSGTGAVGLAAPVLLGWELGAGRGHLTRLAALATTLVDDGRRVVVAVRDPVAARDLFAARPGGRGAALIRAPILRRAAPAGPPGPPPRSLPEILAGIGFADAAILERMVAGWEGLIRRVRPVAVIADSAPGLLLAARGRVPVAAIGSGWAVPPAGAHVPPLPFAPAGPVAVAAATRIVAAAAASRRDARIDTLPALLRGDLAMPLTLPLLDPYGADRAEPVHWPLELAQPTAAAAVEETMIYLPAGHPRLADVLAAAGAHGGRFRAYLGGTAPCGPGNVHVADAPFDLEGYRPSLVIHGGGLGTSAWALVAGIPQVVLPTDLEKAITARLLASGGGAIVGRGDLAREIGRARERVPPRYDLSGMATRHAAASLQLLKDFVAGR